MNIVFSKVHRDNLRKLALGCVSQLYGNKEVYYFHPLIEDVAFSNFGNVKNFKTNRILKQQVNSNGYMGVNVWIQGKGRRFAFVHRLLAESIYSYIGVNNYFYEVNHIDGNKKNNNISNLEWLTRDENLEHARINRLTCIRYGDQSSNCKVSDSDIIDMKEYRKLGFEYKEIAKLYGIDRSHCSEIIRGKRRNK